MASFRFLIGTYTGTGSEGIYGCVLDGQTGELRSCRLKARTENPSYLCANGGLLYAVNETMAYNGSPGGAVSVFRRDTDGLHLAAQSGTEGEAPCHLTVDAEALYCANYMGGSWTRFELDRGLPTGTTSLIRHQGSGPQRKRSPHAHFAALRNRKLWVTDLGLDQVRIYPKDAVGGTPPVYVLSFAEGYGPRHLVFHPMISVVYVVHELRNSVTVHPLDCAGLPQPACQECSLLMDGFCAESAGAAAIRMSDDGRFLYVSIRGQDSVTVFSAAEKDGFLKCVQTVSSMGKGPRDIALSPDGKWLCCANQHSNEVRSFFVHPHNGSLQATEGKVCLEQPVCLLFE